MFDRETMRVFFEIHRDLPREGPGDSASTKRAFALLPDLGADPLILDVGCGPGMQTVDLATLSGGRIVAVDNHLPFLLQLRERAAAAGLTERIRAVAGDMNALPFRDGTFPLIWAEGSVFVIGLEKALSAWRPLLGEPGCIALTDVAWLRSDPPEEARRFWGEEYPAIAETGALIAMIRRAGYRLIDHFTLPESAWWDHHYAPLAKRLPALREKHAHDPRALAVVQSHEREIDIYRRYSDSYGYVFFVMQAAR